MLSRTVTSALLAVAALAAPAAAEAAPSSCPEHFLGGQAPDLVDSRLANKARELCFSEFGVLHSGMTRTPLYSAEKLTKPRVSKALKQKREDAAKGFHDDDRLPNDERAKLSDYAKSGYDRGHLAPNKDMSNAAAQGESFSLANMIPQHPDNNQEIWEGVEYVTRGLALEHGDVYVVTAPVFAGAQTKWLKDRVAIPAQVAKAVYVPATGTAGAYLTNNAPGADWQPVSVAQFRTLTGFDPFPALPEQAKQAVPQLPEPNPHSKRVGGGQKPAADAGALGKLMGLIQAR